MMLATIRAVAPCVDTAVLETTMSPTTSPRYRTKLRAGLLALLLGWAGAHWWYLGRRGAVLYTVIALALLVISQTLFDSRWDNPAFLALFVPATAGFIDGLRLCLMDDARFNARYNIGLPPLAMMGWPTVLLAVATLLIGAIVTMAGVAMINVHIWTAMGWLDGYNF